MKENQIEQWEYKTLYKPSEKYMTEEDLKGWKAYAVTVQPLFGLGQYPEWIYFFYLKGRSKKGGAL